MLRSRMEMGMGMMMTRRGTIKTSSSIYSAHFVNSTDCLSFI